VIRLEDFGDSLPGYRGDEGFGLSPQEQHSPKGFGLSPQDFAVIRCIRANVCVSAKILNYGRQHSPRFRVSLPRISR